MGYFSNKLLNDKNWEIHYNHQRFDATSVLTILLHIRSQIIDSIEEATENDYFIAVGHNNFENFIYVLLASFLGLKIILCDSKMLSTLTNNYKLNYSTVLSTRNIKKLDIPVTVLRPFNLTNRVDSDTNIVESSNQVKLVFMTSGTTGVPKLVVYDEETLFNNAILVGNYLNIKYQDTCLSLFPTNYMYGFSMVFSTLLKSGQVILERTTVSAEEIWESLQKYNITLLPIISSVLRKLQPYFDNTSIFFKNLKVLNASDRIFSDQLKSILHICPEFWNNFGQTESGPRIFALKITSDSLTRLDEVSHNGVIALGKVVDSNITIKILNVDGQECQEGEIGQLCYKTPYMMAGYLTPEGYLKTKNEMLSGDLVYKGKNGHIFWVGRTNEIIKINGKYVNIGLLYKKFESVDFLERSYFIYDEVKGLTAVFVKNNRTKMSEETLKQLVRELFKKNFPNYPTITHMFFLDALPTTLSGKVKHSALVELLKQREMDDAA